MDATIRRLTDGDQTAWAQLRIALWPDCSLERHRLEIAQLLRSNGQNLIAVAEAAGQLVGFAEFSIRSDHVEGTSIAPVPYLEGWYVSPEWRGRGVGRALLAFAEDGFRAQGYSEIASDAEPDNHGSLRAHAALGFREVGRSVHFVKRLA